MSVAPSHFNPNESVQSMAAASFKAHKSSIKKLYDKNPQIDISSLVYAKARLQRILQKPELIQTSKF